MRFNTPIQIALFLSSLLFLIAGVLFYLTAATSYFFLSLILFFVFSVIVIYNVVKRMLHEKIKVIYKNIYKVKGTSRVTELDIENAAQEVEEWAEEKENEILAMKESENYRREFIGNVSHELKTPIFNIQGYVHTLLDGGLHDNEINEKYLIRTNKSVDRMINIVEDLETITRLETEKSELDIRKVNIIDLVNDIFEQLEMKAEAADIKLSLKNESTTQFVLCDLDKIQILKLN